MSNRRKTRQSPRPGKPLPSARIAVPTPARTPGEATFNYDLPADSWLSAEEDEFDAALPQWRQFVARYPTVSDAIAAAAVGEDVSMFLHDMRLWGLTILDGPAGPQGRVVTYATSKLRALSVFSVLNDPDPDQAIATVRQTLDELVQTHGPFPSITAVAETGGTQMPRFGWQTLLDASGWSDWDDFLRDYFASGIDDLQDLTDTTGKLTRDSALCAQHFRQAGLQVAICRSCALPLTDRHPDWPGVWISLEAEIGGPYCNGRDQPYWDDYTLEGFERICVNTGHDADIEPSRTSPHPRFAALALRRP